MSWLLSHNISYSLTTQVEGLPCRAKHPPCSLYIQGYRHHTLRPRPLFRSRMNLDGSENKDRCTTYRASLRFKKTRENIDSYRRFIEKFSLFLNRSEALALTHLVHKWAMATSDPIDTLVFRELGNNPGHKTLCSLFRTKVWEKRRPTLTLSGHVMLPFCTMETGSHLLAEILGNMYTMIWYITEWCTKYWKYLRKAYECTLVAMNCHFGMKQ